MKRTIVEWESYEIPSYGIGKGKQKIGIVGGLGVVTDEVLQRISSNVDVIGIGMPHLRGKNLPTYEDIDGYRVIRPIFNPPLSELVDWARELFKKAGIEFTGTHIKELSLIPFMRDYAMAIPEVRVKDDPEIVCSHDWMAILGGYDKAKTCDVPFVSFLHSLESGRVSGMVHTPLGPKEARPLGIYAGSRTIRDIEVLGLKEADVCFTVGKTMVEEVKIVGESHGVPAKEVENKVFPIHHGVDTKVFHPIKGVEKTYDVVFIGRFAIVKGILEFLDAIRLVKPLVPDIRVKLIGGGELEADIRHKIKIDYLDENIEISTKWHQKEDKVMEINKSRITVAPSKYEPHGQFDLESGACGVPCITGTGGFMERVIPGVTALPCDPFDARDIAEKIYSLLRSDSKIEEMGRNARDFIASNYSWDERAKIYPDIFDKIISGDIKGLSDLPLTVDIESSGFI